MQTHDQRAKKRFPLAIRAMIVDPSGEEGIPCVIRDGSVSGCKIVCDCVDDLPDEIRLDVPNIDQIIEGQIVWRSDRAAGVAFNWKKTSGGERRGVPRQKVDVPALVLDRDFKPLAKCSICDTSRTGCRIVLADGDSVPDEIRIEIEGLTGPAMARVVWREGRFAGVEFIWDSDVYMLEDENAV